MVPTLGPIEEGLLLGGGHCQFTVELSWRRFLIIGGREVEELILPQGPT